MNLVRKHPGMSAIPSSHQTVYSVNHEQVLSSADTWSEMTGKLPISAVERLPLSPSKPASFLPVARLRVLVSGGMFEPSVQPLPRQFHKATRVPSKQTQEEVEFHQPALTEITAGVRTQRAKHQIKAESAWR